MPLDSSYTLSCKDTVAQENFADVDYDRWDDQTPNKSIYISDLHELNARDMLTFNRTFAKPSGNFLGMNKAALKFTRDITVLGKDGENIVVPSTFQLALSLPYGAGEDEIFFFTSRSTAILTKWTTCLDPLFRRLTI